MKPERRTLVFASFNAGKVREVGALLAGLRVRLVGPREVGVESLPEETGETFLDNALLKAAHVYRLARPPMAPPPTPGRLSGAHPSASAGYRETGMCVVADDSGLEVAALGGAPGVHSARYGGREHDDAANIARLLRDLRGVTDRRARFVCHALLVGPTAVLGDAIGRVRVDGVTPVTAHPLIPPGAAAVLAIGEVAGRIVDTPAGDNGFGYDPVFFRDDLGRTFAQLTRDEKNALSHRGQAFKRLKKFLEETVLGRA